MQIVLLRNENLNQTEIADQVENYYFGQSIHFHILIDDYVSNGL